jgi:uncharacterized protein (DUF488 family)
MLYSIGHSTRTLPEFLNELDRRGITQLIDVRSSPWSRNQPFNADQIERWAHGAGILYRKMGNVLGGRSEIALDDPRYLDALETLLDAACREPLAVMCSEGEPSQCHRTWDVAASLLARHGVVVRSILRNGRDEDVTRTLNRVPRSRISPVVQTLLSGQGSLFSQASV